LDISVVFEEQTRRARAEKTREGFKVSVASISHFTILTHRRVRLQALLRELTNQSEIKSRAKWKTVYLLFKADERFT